MENTYLRPVSKINKEYLIRKCLAEIAELNKNLKEVSRLGRQARNKGKGIYTARVSKELNSMIKEKRARIKFYKQFYNN